MNYPVLPTIDEFRLYSGEYLNGKLAGDIKEQSKLFEILCKRAYSQIVEHLVGIKVEDLTDEDILNWKELIMEQAEYLLSRGDKSLIDDDVEISTRIQRMAVTRGLFNLRMRRY